MQSFYKLKCREAGRILVFLLLCMTVIDTGTPWWQILIQKSLNVTTVTISGLQETLIQYTKRVFRPFGWGVDEDNRHQRFSGNHHSCQWSIPETALQVFSISQDLLAKYCIFFFVKIALFFVKILREKTFDLLVFPIIAY